ncbi:hypothetical protein IEZ26_06625 [Nocardioides cavernae]|uniref:Uncharacterized protein n=1 Tax=Nocardioides cavernae TaxID=1921566 RepID=A0ABR8N821_9ACTN|nr:hypothetical protein [Nocardioides cavernae]MBD3924290.1 hypothetical protein [Nocardioides cavernae]MBM7510768.1 hypothetical protein [Nocardioides cavernae]
MDAFDDVIESAKPPKSPRSEDTRRRPSFLLQAVTVAAVATAAFTGITAWETYQDRVNTKAFYCTFAASPEPNPDQTDLAERLDC